MALAHRDIDHGWVTGLCRELAKDEGNRPEEVHVTSFQLASLGDDQGVISRYEKSTNEAIVGHRVLTIHWVSGGQERSYTVVIKSKVPGSTIRRRLEEVYGKLDPELAELQNQLAPSILDDCHIRELHIYELDRPSLKSITPAIKRVWRDPEAQIFAVVMERFEHMRHEKTLDNLDVWLADDIDCALSQIARVHGDFLGEISAAHPPPWLLPFHHMNNARLLAYQGALLRYNATAFPELFDPGRAKLIEALLSSAEKRHRAIMQRPLTLIHGDFTPRNVCLRTNAAHGARLCAYDWELAQVHLPQRDVCEFLCYVLNPARGWKDESTAELLERYRRTLQEVYGQPIERAQFEQDLSMAIAEFCTFKLLVQGITHQLLGNRYYFERLVQNAFDGMAVFADRVD